MKINRLLFLAMLMVGVSYTLNAQVYINVGINQPPALVADAGTDGSICVGDSVQIGSAATGGTSPYTYAWTPNSDLSNPAGASPWASPSATTTYVQSVTDNIGCTSSDTVEVSVSAIPVAAFTTTPNLLDIQFNDATTPTPTSWAWTFGDGGTDNTQNPLHTYASPGVYLVCLNVTIDGSCADDTCETITVSDVGIGDPYGENSITVYPNPYSQETMISFSLQNASDVKLDVYNLAGQKVSTLVDHKLGQGEHEYPFSAGNLGHAAGTYIVKLRIDKKEYSVRIVETH